MRFRVVLCTVLFAFPTLAAKVTVGCAGGSPGDYPTITAAVAALNGLMVVGPLKAIFPAVVPGISAIELKINVPPSMVKVRLASTCNVCTFKLPVPLNVTGPENCAEIGPDLSAFGKPGFETYVGS